MIRDPTRNRGSDSVDRIFQPSSAAMVSAVKERRAPSGTSIRGCLAALGAVALMTTPGSSAFSVRLLPWGRNWGQGRQRGQRRGGEQGGAWRVNTAWVDPGHCPRHGSRRAHLWTLTSARACLATHRNPQTPLSSLSASRPPMAGPKRCADPREQVLSVARVGRMGLISSGRSRGTASVRALTRFFLSSFFLLLLVSRTSSYAFPLSASLLFSPHGGPANSDLDAVPQTQGPREPRPQSFNLPNPRPLPLGSV